MWNEDSNARIVKNDPEACPICMEASIDGIRDEVMPSPFDHPVWLHDELVAAGKIN